MQHNILKQSDVTTIHFIYTDNKGSKKRYNARLRFMDAQECYFSIPLPVNFEKPKKKTPVEIKVYTPDGVYKTNVVILDTTMSMQDALFSVSMPNTWSFLQMRQSSRKQVQLPVSIKFDDGFEIKTESHDLSLGGVSYITKTMFSSIYERLNCIVTVELPDTLINNLPDRKLVAPAKFTRSKKYTSEYRDEGELVAFRFVTLSMEQQAVLKGYLLSLD